MSAQASQMLRHAFCAPFRWDALETGRARPCAAAKPREKRQPVAPKPSKRKPLRKVKAAGVPGSAHDDIFHLVGDVRETDCEHRRRHPAGRGWEKSCPRCDHMANHTAWERMARCCGPTARLVARGETSWLCPKPAYLGGAWGLGCCLCAAARQSKRVQQARAKDWKENKKNGLDHRRMSRMRTKWARYEHRHVPGNVAHVLDAHSNSKCHKLACQALCSPDSHIALAPVLEPDRAEAACSAEAETAARSAETTAACSALPTARGANLIATVDLFKGRVPQVQEWLEAWAECSSSVSYLKQARMKRKRGQEGTVNGHRFQLKNGRRDGGGVPQKDEASFKSSDCHHNLSG